MTDENRDAAIRSIVVRVRFSPQDLDDMTRVAMRNGVPVSTWIRQQARARADEAMRGMPPRRPLFNPFEPRGPR